MTDPGLVADVMTHGPEGAKALLCRLGVVEHAEVCEHDWHYYGTVNGRPEYACQSCGLVRRDDA